MTNIEEIWKDVPNYEGLYQVSNLGNVKSVRRNRKNFIRTDNRLENIEVVTARQNGNLKHISHSSIYTGVSLDKKIKRKKWCAHIKINGKKKHLGYFDDEYQAHLAYEKARNEI
jgi:hypothetical protein